MYGTVARMRVKPGMDAQMQEEARSRGAQIAGLVATYVYQMDADPQEYYLAVVFESKEAYVANAGSPEQHASYLRIRALMERDPEWHDGTVIQQG